MRSNFTPGRASLIAWLVVIIATLVWTASAVRSGTWLRSNVFELLPDSDYDALKETATRVVERELGAQLLFLVGHTDREIAKASAEHFGQKLQTHPSIASVSARVERGQFAAIASFYFPYRRQLLSDKQLDALVKDAGNIVRDARAMMYSPMGAGGSESLTKDPFFLLSGSLQALQPVSGSLQLDGAFLVAEQNGLNYVLVMARMTSPTLSIEEQDQLAVHLDETTTTAVATEPGLDFLRSGFFFYAHAGTQSAKSDISVIGLGSLLGLLTLVILTFRSLRPLTLIVLTVVSGCVFALAVTLAVFGFVHLFTLVFGASLIGVSVDYSFHYAAEDAFGGKDWTPDEGLRKIFMGITLGLLTSVLAYLALTVAPFPGLQQLALFSSAGLIGAYLTLLCCCNLWRRRLVVDERSHVPRAAGWYLGVWLNLSSRYRFLIVAALALVVLAGFRLIEINDNVSVLQSQPEELKRQEAMIRDILGVDPGSTFLLVPSSSDDGVLQLEESLRVALERMIEAGTLGGYQAVSRWVPSRARQAQSLSAYSNLISTQLADYFESLGVSEGMTAEVVAELTRDTEALEIDAWLEHPVSAQFRNLWLDVGEDKSASIILLYGLQDTIGLREALVEFPSVVVANKAEEMSNLFGQYRVRVTWVLAAAYAIILLGLATRYGLRQSAILLIPPVFAGALALIIISVIGNSLNLFNFLAMILVLGIGIDFTLFLAEARGDRRVTMFAITLSALTTMLSFGLLSLSSTYAVHSFGITVLIGIACAYLLSPLAVVERSRLPAE